MSAWAFAIPPSFFTGIAVGVAAVDPPPIPVSGAVTVAAGGGRSWLFPLVAVVAVSGDGDVNGNAAAATGGAELVWSTFRAVVDSEIAPDLNFGFGLAWIPV